ncbi:MAG: trigger factor [Cytophagales bacterium]|nr:MAG: trigger factor [Cytophagales bacterium]
MEILLEKKDELNATLKVSMTEADYQPKVVAKLKEYSKTASMKGFRPGKVPQSLMQKMYGKSILVDEINNMLSTGITDYIKENKLEILGDPLPNTKEEGAIDWETQKDFQFYYDLGLVPDFSYDLKTLKINKYEILVDKEVLDTTLNNVKKQFGKSVNPDTSVEGDSLYCEITSPSGVSSKGEIYLERVVKQYLPLFINKSKGAIVETEISSLFEEAHVLAHLMGVKTEEAAELVGKYKFEIININRKEDAEIGQELFDKMFGKDTVTDEATFLSKLEDTIKENYLRESEYLIGRDIKKSSVDAISFNLPQEFLKRWLLVTNQGKITEEEIGKEIEQYLKELKWNLIKNRLAKDFELNVSYAEVLDAAKNNLKRQFGGMEFSAEMEESITKIVESQLQQDKGKAYMQTLDELLTHKVTNLISSQANMSDKKITVKEFEKIISE